MESSSITLKKSFIIWLVLYSTNSLHQWPVQMDSAIIRAAKKPVVEIVVMWWIVIAGMVDGLFQSVLRRGFCILSPYAAAFAGWIHHKHGSLVIRMIMMIRDCWFKKNIQTKSWCTTLSTRKTETRSLPWLSYVSWSIYYWYHLTFAQLLSPMSYAQTSGIGRSYYYDFGCLHHYKKIRLST